MVTDRVLMVDPSYKDYLDIPGGYVENGETPYRAAQREVFEELGIEPPIGRLVVADWWPDSPEANGGAKLQLVFDGGVVEATLTDQIRVDGEEILAVSFEEISALRHHTIQRLANRISKAYQSRQDGEVRYLEAGLDPNED